MTGFCHAVFAQFLFLILCVILLLILALLILFLILTLVLLVLFVLIPDIHLQGPPKSEFAKNRNLNMRRFSLVHASVLILWREKQCHQKAKENGCRDTACRLRDTSGECTD